MNPLATHQLSRFRFRRTAYLFFHLADGTFLDIHALLNGRVRLKSMKQVRAVPVLNGRECAISLSDLRFLNRIPSDRWIRLPELMRRFKVPAQRVSKFVDKGFVLTDQPSSEMELLRRRDEQLSAGAWNIYAATYHFMTKWHNVHLGLDSQFTGSNGGGRTEDVEEARNQDLLQDFIDRYGRPPHHFHSVNAALAVRKLPLVKRRTTFYRVLLDRRTTRVFDPTVPLTIQQLAVILYYVFGCHGYAGMTENVVGLKKTSPSGGGLHPTEVYLLVMNVKRLRSGLYHYNVRDHSLELMSPLQRSRAIQLADEFTAGQSFPRDAQALFIMTARFYRNFWKYRQHRKAYSVLLMDAAHLSQTFYLVCAELGLGAFLTAAINHINIEEQLGLDGFAEGAIALTGCGKPIRSENDFDPTFCPYVPRQSSPIR